MRNRQPTPLDFVARKRVALHAFCEGLRRAARHVYEHDPSLALTLGKEASSLESFAANRACIEADNESLPPELSPFGEFLAWQARNWGDASADLERAVARTDQLLGRQKFMACFDDAAH